MNLFSRTFQGPFMECHVTCLTPWSHSVWTKLATIYDQNCTFQALCCKTNANTPLQLRNVKPAPCGMHKSISTHIHNRLSIWCQLTFWLMFSFAFFTQFFAVFPCLSFFTKLKRKNTLILTNYATLLRRFSFYVARKIQGLFKTVRTLLWNYFQGWIRH